MHLWFIVVFMSSQHSHAGCVICVVFFKQKTAYEMRISDWSSDVCSSDLVGTLTYLHGIISTRRHRVAVPETPIYLDAILVDMPFSGGLEPMLGDRHLRTLTILGFPNLTRPGLLDALNELRFP